MGRCQWHRFGKVLSWYKAKILGFTLSVAVYWLQTKLETSCKYQETYDHTRKWKKIFQYTLNGACLALRPQEVYDRHGFYNSQPFIVT